MVQLPVADLTDAIDTQSDDMLVTLGDYVSRTGTTSPGNKHIEDYPVKYHLVLIVSLVSAFSGGSTISYAEESPVPKPHPFGKDEHVVQQMNGEYELEPPRRARVHAAQRSRRWRR